MQCSGCGEPRDESMDPKAEGQYKTRLVVCHACAEKSKAHKDMADENTEPGAHLLVQRLPPRGGAGA